VISGDQYDLLCTAEKICDGIVVIFSIGWDCCIRLGVWEFLCGSDKRGIICLLCDWGSDLVIPKLGTICGLFCFWIQIQSMALSFLIANLNDGPFDHWWYLQTRLVFSKLPDRYSTQAIWLPLACIWVFVEQLFDSIFVTVGMQRGGKDGVKC